MSTSEANAWKRVQHFQPRLKTCILIILNKFAVRHIEVSDTPRDIFNGTSLKSGSSIKHLAVTFKSSVRVLEYITNVVKKTYSVMFSILRDIKCSNEVILLRLYKSA